MLPELFLERMKGLLKEEYGLFLESFEGEPYKALRLNLLKCREDFIKKGYFTLKPVPWAPCGYYYEEQEKPGKHPFHEAGVYYIQEPSAMAPVPFLEVHPGERVLDLCAAPGGKSTQIAGYMEGEGILFCNEIHPKRAQILSENIERCGIRNAIVTNETPEKLSKVFTGYFDKILVDAPCSGEGMFRKNEEAVTEWSEENVRLCAARQDEVLGYAAKMLRPGGRLVYSTCTFAPAENEGSISRFLKTHPDFSLVRVAAPEGFVCGRADWITEPAGNIDKTLRIMPHKVKGEGHFLAVLIRNGDTLSEGAFPQGGLERSIAQKEYKEFLEFAKETLTETKTEELLVDRTLLRFGDNLYTAPKQLPALKGLKVLRPGLHLGTMKKNRFEPSHALALHLKKEDVNSSLDFALSDAAVEKFLTGQTLTIGEGCDVPFSDGKGYTLILVDGYSIGWGKIAGNIVKNHYPKGLRK